MNLNSLMTLGCAVILLAACKPPGDRAPEYAATGGSTYDVAWDQGYNEMQTSRPSSAKTYKLLDYTRSIYFDGFATIAQTQQRLALILESSRIVHISTERKDRFVLQATDASPYYRNQTAKQLLKSRFH